MQRNRPSVKLEARSDFDVAGLPTRYFHPGELETLLTLYASVEPRRIIEFGVNTGRNAAAALRNFPQLQEYVGVDVLPGYVTQMAVQRKEIPEVPGQLAAHDPRFTLIVSARGSFDLSPGDLGFADAAFIDADHSRDGVMNDFAIALSAVRPGGLIIFHDDNCLPVVQVTQTLNELCEGGHKIVHFEGTWLAAMEVQ